jgi:protoheme IX farnesyltransferase
VLKKSTIQTYYKLTKPGIVYGNAVTALAGFLLASKGHIHFFLLIETLLGISFVIASACVLNNYIDKDIDKKMARTKNRALVTGAVSGRNALIYMVFLGMIGALFMLQTNILTIVLGTIAFVDYIFFYAIAKRTSVYSTIVGSISGAMPPVAGYTAVTNHFDMGAFLLFLILVCWQMPHFYAIAIFRLKDYTSAHIPILPAIQGLPKTKIHMVLYCIAFIVSTLLLPMFHYTKYTYAITMLLLGSYWLFLCIKGFYAIDDIKWAKNVFRFSLILILVFSLLLSFNVILP